MADNNRNRLIPCSMIERLALVIIAVLSTSFSLVLAIFILVVAVLRPPALPEATIVDTTRIEIDLNFDHGPPPEHHLREPYPRHHGRRPSPHPAAHARRYPLYQPYYPNTPPADHERPLPRTPSPIEETPLHRAREWQPVLLHTVQPGNNHYTTSVHPSEGHLPPPLPIIATDSENGSHSSYEGPLPPARRFDGEYLHYARRPSRRPRRPQSAPIYAREPEEPLPVYERPPDYDADDRGSQ